MTRDLAPPLAALQQRRAPRPLPLFLELVRVVAAKDPELARAALIGLRRYEEAEPPGLAPVRPAVVEHGPASLRDCGGTGPLLVLVPSLINPPHVLDLDRERSLAGALAASHRVLLLDWGPAAGRSDLDLSAHVHDLLLPLLRSLGPVRLVGYCLGGTLALAAAQQLPSVAAVATLASPWRFGSYEAEARRDLLHIWNGNRAAAQQLGSLPMEVLQSCFWLLDPERTVAKFARFGELEPGSAEAGRFVALEEWANGGEPLPVPAARELVEDLFGADLPATGTWRGGALPSCPTLHITAAADRIVPEASAPPGPTLRSSAGHVGMIVGRQAPTALHAPLREWLEGSGRGG